MANKDALLSKRKRIAGENAAEPNETGQTATFSPKEIVHRLNKIATIAAQQFREYSQKKSDNKLMRQQMMIAFEQTLKWLKLLIRVHKNNLRASEEFFKIDEELDYWRNCSQFNQEKILEKEDFDISTANAATISQVLDKVCKVHINEFDEYEDDEQLVTEGPTCIACNDFLYCVFP